MDLISAKYLVIKSLQKTQAYQAEENRSFDKKSGSFDKKSGSFDEQLRILFNSESWCLSLHRIAQFRYISMVVLILTTSNIFGQEDNSKVNKSRLKWIIGIYSTTYTGSLIALNELWYKDQPRSSFHFFDDSKEWLQVDKIGHLYSSYHVSKLSYTTLRWAGLSDKKAYLYGGLFGILFMTPIEILDGFSAGYGASATDMIANITGAGLHTTQGLLWGEARIHPKYSFHRSGLAPLRPNTLGSNFSEELLKDYNSQTYWLSIDLHAFNQSIPKWINVSLGYGAHQMIYAHTDTNKSKGYKNYRQFYLGLDIDLSYIESKSWVANTLLYIANMIKIPLPALEYNNEQKLTFHFFAY